MEIKLIDFSISIKKSIQFEMTIKDGKLIFTPKK